MIAPLRRRQAMAALLLSVAAPLLLSIGLAARPDPAEDLSWLNLSSDDPIIEGLGYRYRVTNKRLGDTDTKLTAVDIDPRGGLAVPDVLVYGHRGEAPQESLPEMAEWLGRLYLDRPSSFDLFMFSNESEEHYTIYFVSMVRAGLVGSVDIGPILGSE